MSDYPDNACPFCDITPERILEQDELALAIADRYPVTDGHSLILPRRHISIAFELSMQEIRSITRLLQIMRCRLDRERSPAGYNIGINIGPVAGQTVMHTHVHLIPRYSDDVEDPTGGVRNVIPLKGRYP
jgi:diadenosine tetraphosphate (Ap4A) HIT family hydrolase